VLQDINDLADEYNLQEYIPLEKLVKEEDALL
jgi:hypothetical protein